MSKAFSGLNFDRANARAALLASALKEYGARSKTAMGTRSNISLQRCQSQIWTKLSAPITQTKYIFGKHVFKARSVSRVKRVPSRCSTSVTRMSGWRANASAPAIRSLKGAMPSIGLRGFCGETIHHTSSSPRCLSANKLIWRCPSWAGLNDPPRMPTRRPGPPKPRRIKVGTVRAAPARCRAPRTCTS